MKNEKEKVCCDCGSVIECEIGITATKDGWHCADCAGNAPKQEIKELAAKYNDILSQIKILENEKDVLRNAIISQMGDELEISDGHYKVVRTITFTNRIDTTSLKKEIPDIAEKYTKQSSSERLSVSLAF